MRRNDAVHYPNRVDLAALSFRHPAAVQRPFRSAAQNRAGG
jgi:hypothetical protein